MSILVYDPGIHPQTTRTALPFRLPEKPKKCYKCRYHHFYHDASLNVWYCSRCGIMNEVRKRKRKRFLKRVKNFIFCEIKKE
jgi:acetyl-CoA carboxylase beta subunit